MVVRQDTSTYALYFKRDFYSDCYYVMVVSLNICGRKASVFVNVTIEEVGIFWISYSNLK